MDIKEIKNEKTEMLEKKLQDLGHSLHELLFQASSQQLKQVRDIRVCRKNIARVKTVLNERLRQ